MIKRAVALITDDPDRWPMKDGSRRFVLHRFPYTLAYVVEGQFVSIIAVAHHSRDPAAWKDRR